MAKAPAFQFYPNDWSRDLEEHPLEIEGAWIRICCKLWWSETRGELTRTPDQWAKILRVDLDAANHVISYINSWQIGDVLTLPNGNITIQSRRMIREEKDRQNNCLRQKRHYQKKQPNTEPNANITVPSSASASSSSSDKELKSTPEPFGLPSKDQIENGSEELILELITDASDHIYHSGLWPSVHSFANKMLKNGCNPRAILHSLCQVVIKKPHNPWAYCVRIMSKEDGNFNARDYEKNSG